jgi:hypothetical protein
MNAKLLLCCHGLKEFGMTMCNGCANEILDFRKIPDTDERLYSYLDYHCKIFDAVNTDTNKVSSIVNFLCNNKYMATHQEEIIFKFIKQHRSCGLYMYVQPL